MRSIKTRESMDGRVVGTSRSSTGTSSRAVAGSVGEHVERDQVAVVWPRARRRPRLTASLRKVPVDRVKIVAVCRISLHYAQPPN